MYADAIDILGRSKRYVIPAFSANELESTKGGLPVNEDVISKITADNYTFDIVKEFIYLRCYYQKWCQPGD